MANFQGNRINPSRFSRSQIKFHVIFNNLGEIVNFFRLYSFSDRRLSRLESYLDFHRQSLFTTRRWITSET